MMNDSESNTGCLRWLPLLPTKEQTVKGFSWQWSKHTLHQYSECVDLETYITKTVPCPPPWNPCLFWSIVKKTKLTQSDLDHVRETCVIPNHIDCTVLSSAVRPEIEDCNETCVALIILFSCFLISMVIVFAIAVWKFRTKWNLPEFCNGVCVCFDKVFIRKNRLNRTESRSPTLATENGKTDKFRKDSSEDGYDNECISLDFQHGRADYFLKSLEKGNGIMEDDGDYETLREDGIIDRNSYPAPDVTMVTVIDDEHGGRNRLSSC